MDTASFAAGKPADTVSDLTAQYSEDRRFINKISTLLLLIAPEGFEDSSSASVEKAVRRILRLLYARMELPSEAISDHTPTKEERNAEIYQRYLTGKRAVDLAREYGMSLQRIYKIIRNQKKRR